MPANSARAFHVDTCGVRLPRRMSDADAFEQPIACTISESGTVASRDQTSWLNSSGSYSVPVFARATWAGSLASGAGD